MHSSFKGLIIAVLLSALTVANECPKFFPMPALEGYVVVTPIYPENVTGSDLDCDGIVDDEDADMDGDGIPNGTDAFPHDASESIDTDGDGVGNNADTDDDNDGYSDADEIMAGSDPLNPQSIPVVNGDDLFAVTPIAGTSTQVSFSIALKNKPDANVTLSFHSDDETVAKPTGSTIVFTPDDWYRYQRITVDILDPNATTQITFDPVQSDDARYAGKQLSPVNIVSHLLKLFEPVDGIVYSEFNMSIPLSMAYVGDREADLTITLEQAPNGMVWDAQTHRLLWRPDVTDEGSDVSVQVRVSDGSLVDTKTFELHVAQPRALSTSVADGKLVVNDVNSSLNGMSIEPLESNVSLGEYRLYELSANDTPALSQDEVIVNEPLLIKGNIGKKVRVTLPLQGLVSNDELLSFHTKSYYGSGQWRRIDYDYDFNGTASAPVYLLTTEELAGVIAFTKRTGTSTHSTAKTLNLARLQRSASSITCEPKRYFDTLVDYNNQICTFSSKPGFTLRIYDYTKSAMYPYPIENIAGWINEAQTALDSLSMPYLNDFYILFDKIEHYGETTNYDLFSNGVFLEIRIFPKSSIVLSTLYHELDTKTALIHEYFHHSQYIKMRNSYLYNENSWYTEATAVWFEDFVQNNKFLAYKYWYVDNIYPEIFEQGFLKDPIVGVDEQGEPITNNLYYANGLFFEMLEGHCSNFIDNFSSFFMDYGDNNPTGFINFTNVAYQLDCNFGSPTGQGNEQRIETKLLYYQYATAIKQDTMLINSQAQDTLVFGGASRVIGTHTWSTTQKDVELYKKWYDTAAETVKVERVNETLSQCYERYIHIESDKYLMVSMASKDSNFPDTPNTMLGDMKQINFTIQGKYDFTYFYDSDTGRQVYPELYITMVDVVENVFEVQESNQTVKMSYGIRRRNILTHINGNDVCSALPPITQTTVELRGDIPSHYRDAQDSSRYIDTIKITDVNSGNTYTASVTSDGTWRKTITFTFNNNEAPILVDGYNHTDMNRVIARDGVLIWR